MKRIAFLKLFVMAIILLIIFLPGYVKLLKFKMRKEKFAKDVEELKVTNQKLLNEQERLKKDINYVEKVAREKVGFVKKGEIVYRVVSE